MDNSKKLLSNKESAAYLGIKTNTLTVWRCKNTQKIPYVKLGRRVFYRLKDLDSFIDKNQIGGDIDD